MKTGHALAAANIAYAALLVAASAVPPVTVPGQALSDTTSHALAYGIQGVLLFVLLVERTMRPARAALAAVLGATLLGALTESIQLLIVTRSSEWRDVAADAVGATLGVAAGLAMISFARARSGRSAP